jgi:hypothetical protein
VKAQEVVWVIDEAEEPEIGFWEVHNDFQNLKVVRFDEMALSDIEITLPNQNLKLKIIINLAKPEINKSYLVYLEIDYL